MAELQRAQSVLVISSSEKSGRIIASLINPSLCHPIQFEKSGGASRRKLQQCHYDMIVVNTPLSDEFGHDLAVDLARETSSGIILLVKSDVYEEICDRVGDVGVLTVQKPLSSQLFHQTIRLASAARARVEALERENRRLKSKLEESKVVSRAKCILVEHQKMSEAQAHRYIEKQAMDSRMARRAVAENIIKMYEG